MKPIKIKEEPLWEENESHDVPVLPQSNPNFHMDQHEYDQIVQSQNMVYRPKERKDVDLKLVMLEEIGKIKELWPENPVKRDRTLEKHYREVARKTYGRTGARVDWSVVQKFFQYFKTTLKRKLKEAIILKGLNREKTEEYLWNWNYYPYGRFYRVRTQQLVLDLRMAKTKGSDGKPIVFDLKDEDGESIDETAVDLDEMEIRIAENVPEFVTEEVVGREKDEMVCKEQIQPESHKEYRTELQEYNSRGQKRTHPDDSNCFNPKKSRLVEDQDSIELEAINPQLDSIPLPETTKEPNQTEIIETMELEIDSKESWSEKEKEVVEADGGGRIEPKSDKAEESRQQKVSKPDEPASTTVQIPLTQNPVPIGPMESTSKETGTFRPQEVIEHRSLEQNPTTSNPNLRSSTPWLPLKDVFKETSAVKLKEPVRIKIEIGTKLGIQKEIQEEIQPPRFNVKREIEESVEEQQPDPVEISETTAPSLKAMIKEDEPVEDQQPQVAPTPTPATTIAPIMAKNQPEDIVKDRQVSPWIRMPPAPPPQIISPPLLNPIPIQHPPWNPHSQMNGWMPHTSHITPYQQQNQGSYNPYQYQDQRPYHSPYQHFDHSAAQARAIWNNLLRYIPVPMASIPMPYVPSLQFIFEEYDRLARHNPIADYNLRQKFWKAIMEEQGSGN